MCDDEDDDKLCIRAQSGDQEAFARLFHRYYDSLHAFAYRLCTDLSGAEDITQEAFIKAARYLADFRREASFKNWLYRIALHAARDWQRRTLHLRQMAEVLTLEAATHEATRDHDFTHLEHALAQLPEAHRHALVLVYYEEMDHRTAATILGCAETTVSWRIFRAKRQLKNSLTKGLG